MIEVPVDLPGRACRLLAGPGLLAQAGTLCAEAGLHGTCAIITDENVGRLHGAAATQSLATAGFAPRVLTVPAGENSKSLSAAEDLIDRMLDAGLDRGSFVVALGGGVVGDLAGFVAAIYLRGIPCVQIPTSIVAQVDSSVGGKTGVNARAGKNLIGAFHQPRLVLADTLTLETFNTFDISFNYVGSFKRGVLNIIKGAVDMIFILDNIRDIQPVYLWDFFIQILVKVLLCWTGEIVEYRVCCHIISTSLKPPWLYRVVRNHQ